MKVPVTPPASNRLERESEVSVGLDGIANVKSHERSFGETAASIRYRQTRASNDEYRRQVERWLARAVGTPHISQIQGAPAPEAPAQFERTVEYSAANFAQIMQGRLTMVKPLPAPFYEAPFSEPRRKHPVLLESESRTETVRVAIPAGFEVDELPDAVKLQTSYGKYTASYSVEAGVVAVKRAIEVRASTVPVEKYGELRSFFSHVLGSVHAPIVCVKK